MKARFGAAFLAPLIAAAVAGCAAASSPPSPGSGADSTASPSPSSGAHRLPAGGMLGPGTYVLGPGALHAVADQSISFRVPSTGWNSWGPGVARIGDNESVIGLGFVDVANVYADPCHTDRGPLDPPLGPTADDLTAALADLSGYVTVGPSDVSLGGASGQYLELTIKAGFDLDACDDAEYISYIPRAASGPAWETPGGHTGLYAAFNTRRFWILDADGVRLLVDVFVLGEPSANDRAALEETLDSIGID